MSKLNKAIKHPRKFLIDAWLNRIAIRDLHKRVASARASGRKIAVLVGFSAWKTWMRDFFPDHEVVFLGHSPHPPLRLLRALVKIGEVEVYAWSYKHPAALKDICDKANLPLTFVEDGWIRSIGLGVSKTTPLSLVFDRKAMHFDRQKVSALEEILSGYDFSGNQELMARARSMIKTLTGSGISKYNGLGDRVDLRWDLGIREGRECVLVIGQVEDDFSLAYGMQHPMTGNGLVFRAAEENPGAIILYRPHPESRVVWKSHYSDPDDVAHFAYLVPEGVSLAACFDVATKVYTMTSLAGFEALLHGVPVKTFGCPFYAGWGVTEDVDPALQRRKRRLSVEEIFAAAYILYPRYWCPVSFEPIEAEQALEYVCDRLSSKYSATQASDLTGQSANVGTTTIAAE
jgi:capsular polysaccharide export protein